MHARIISPNTPARLGHDSRGFTAIELMVVVSILAILAALAAPSFNPLIERWRVRQTVEGLQATLFYARSEAIKRGGRVVVQKLPNSSGCALASTTSDWGCGWLVCEDTNANNACNSGEPVLQRFDTSPRVEVTRSDSGGATISFNRWGLAAQGVGISIVPQGKSTSDTSSRGLCVSSAGRVRIIPADQIPCDGSS